MKAENDLLVSIVFQHKWQAKIPNRQQNKTLIKWNLVSSVTLLISQGRKRKVIPKLLWSWNIGHLNNALKHTELLWANDLALKIVNLYTHKSFLILIREWV